MVDNQLMSLGQSVHQAIACAPFDWIDLGCRLCSKVIFKDALIHIVGLCHKSVAGPEGISTNNNNSGGYANPHAKVESMAESVRELVYSKIADLQRECQNAEQRMATYYPAHLQRESVSGRADRDDIGRQSYSADIFAWMALSLFRHYLSQAVIAVGHKGLAYTYGSRIRMLTVGRAKLTRLTMVGAASTRAFAGAARRTSTVTMSLVSTTGSPCLPRARPCLSTISTRSRQRLESLLR